MRARLAVSALCAAALAALGTSAAQAQGGGTDDASTALRASNAGLDADPSTTSALKVLGGASALGTRVMDRVMSVSSGVNSRDGQVARLAELRAQGRAVAIHVGRVTGSWAEGAVTISATSAERAFPDGWLWFATYRSGAWHVALESDADFGALASRSATLSETERQDFVAYAAGNGAKNATPNAAPDATTAAITTGLQLPWTVNTYGVITQMPHPYGSSGGPFSSIDAVGNDHTVRAAASGTIRSLCGSSPGWLRIIHQPSYSTDYYHLNNAASIPSKVAKNATIGTVGTHLCAGGSTSGPHVHFSLRTHDTNGTGNGAYVSLNDRTVGGWTFHTGYVSGAGSATSTRTGSVGRNGDPFYNYSS